MSNKLIYYKKFYITFLFMLHVKIMHKHVQTSEINACTRIQASVFCECCHSIYSGIVLSLTYGSYCYVMEPFDVFILAVLQSSHWKVLNILPPPPPRFFYLSLHCHIGYHVHKLDKNKYEVCLNLYIIRFRLMDYCIV